MKRRHHERRPNKSCNHVVRNIRRGKLEVGRVASSSGLQWWANIAQITGLFLTVVFVWKLYWDIHQARQSANSQAAELRVQQEYQRQALDMQQRTLEAQLVSIESERRASLIQGQIEAEQLRRQSRSLDAQLVLISNQEAYAAEQRDYQRLEMLAQAWQAISTAQGKGGSGGRRFALELLHRHGESLCGVNVIGDTTSSGVGRGARLEGLQIPGADIAWACFRGAWLDSADFSGVSAWCADFRNARLNKASFRNAKLSVDLSHAKCVRTDFRGAEIIESDLRHADLTQADLRGATVNAWMYGIDLRDADISGADFDDGIAASYTGLHKYDILMCRDWRGADLPQDLDFLELPETASEEDMDRLGRGSDGWREVWKPPDGLE